MIKKYCFVYVIVPAMLILSFRLPGYKPITTAPFFSDSLLTPLALYGRYIYQRENCARCHSLVYDSTDSKMISLDGLGGRQFSDGWHYRHMRDPGSITLDSKMPAFPALFVNKIDPGMLQQLYKQLPGNQHSSDTTAPYHKLQQEAIVMAKNLKEQGLPGHDLQQQEIIALIAYLQQIPTGPQRRYKDSLWMSAFKNQAAAWDKAITTDSNRLMRLAGSTNKDTVVMGARLFNERYCWVCHGRQGEGGAGPNLTDSYWLHGSSSTAIMQVIANGKPDRGMQGFKTQISPEEIGLLTAYINALKNTDPPNAKAPQGNKYW